MTHILDYLEWEETRLKPGSFILLCFVKGTSPDCIRCSRQNDLRLVIIKFKDIFRHSGFHVVRFPRINGFWGMCSSVLSA